MLRPSWHSDGDLLTTHVQPALRGILVISVGHTLPGLHCLASLRDLGAQVVRIERLPPRGSETERYQGMEVAFPIRSLIAGTEALTLNLKHPLGPTIFRRLAARADVVLEGFRPGVMQRLGLDYPVLSRDNPRLVYAAITGYGQSGAYRDRAGHDVNYLAETGVLALGNPLGLPGATFADGMAGVSAALNIVAALHGRAQSGQGQMLDCAIVDGPLSLMSSEFEYYWNHGESRGSGDTHLTGCHPWYGVYSTRDGKSVAIGAVEPAFYQALCHALDLPELARLQHATGKRLQAARAKITAAIAARSRDELAVLFRDHQACVSPVLETAEVLASPLGERAVRVDPESGERRVRSPVRLLAVSAPQGQGAARSSGESVLKSFGFADDEVEEWITLGVTSGNKIE